MQAESRSRLAVVSRMSAPEIQTQKGITQKALQYRLSAYNN